MVSLKNNFNGATRVLAPMVDASELTWRVLCRKYGAQVCYTPMFHARLFREGAEYRRKMFFQSGLEGSEIDRPLIVQFCANNCEDFVGAAKFVEGHCDAVDLNLGCPQGIARKGHYGAFLQDEWQLIASIITSAKAKLNVPVTAKIRIFSDRKRTLKYAKMLLEAGVDGLTVHARTREQKGQATGMADWSYLTFLRENLPNGILLMGNGNICTNADFDECISTTGVDAVLSAEGALCNPAIFMPATASFEERHPRVDALCREYIDLCRHLNENRGIKTHLFRLLRHFLETHTDIRDELSHARTLEDFEGIVDLVEKRVAQILLQGGLQSEDLSIRCSTFIRRDRKTL